MRLFQTMLTRNRSDLAVEIDFDHASKCWLQNKKKLGGGGYRYICGSELKDGGYCQRILRSGEVTCSFHKKAEQEKDKSNIQ